MNQYNFENRFTGNMKVSHDIEQKRFVKYLLSIYGKGANEVFQTLLTR